MDPLFCRPPGKVDIQDCVPSGSEGQDGQQSASKRQRTGAKPGKDSRTIEIAGYTFPDIRATYFSVWEPVLRKSLWPKNTTHAQQKYNHSIHKSTFFLHNTNAEPALT
jgi:hypothetical protein